MQNLSGHQAIVNTLAVNSDNVLVSGGWPFSLTPPTHTYPHPPTADNGSMYFWDWRSGYCFQKLQTTVQPGSLDSEAGIFACAFDRSGCRLLTAETDKTIKIYKEDETAVCLCVCVCTCCNCCHSLRLKTAIQLIGSQRF